MSVSGVIMSLLLAASVPSQVDCPTIAGFDQILENRKTQFIVMGEFHGTNEMPQIFADAVCLASKERPISVALEMPEADQQLINTYLASNGDFEAKQDFLKAQIWKNDFKDGRSSEAIFALFDRLRAFQAAGKIQSVVAFQPTKWLSNAKYERAMAELIKAQTPKHSRVLVFVGNVHAMRTKVAFGPKPYVAMAGYLPKKSTLTLNIVDDGGSAWACTGPKTCGVITSHRPKQNSTRGVVIEAQRNAAYDGVLFLGAATTASPPQQPLSK
jgi:hypothetical protein